MPDFNDLPYTENGGFAPKSFRLLAFVAAGGMALGKVTGYLTIDWIDAVVPLAVIGALYLLHHAVRAAVHEATRMADADAALDDVAVEQTARAARSTLTPTVLSRKIAEGAE